MRLGQILVAAGRITPAQLDEGLRSQVLHGGRLGTNLVELGHLDLDGLALALARRHGIPAALLKHFERCDMTVQGRLPVSLAAQWSVVPIGHLADRRNRIAVAAMDPLPPHAAALIGEALRCAGPDLVVSVAGELRIRYYLERCYGIARESRFLRVRRATQSGVPVPPPELVDDRGRAGSESEATIPVERISVDDLAVYLDDGGDVTGYLAEDLARELAGDATDEPSPFRDHDDDGPHVTVDRDGWRVDDRAPTEGPAGWRYDDRAPTASEEEPAAAETPAPDAAGPPSISLPGWALPPEPTTRFDRSVDDAFDITFDLLADQAPPPVTLPPTPPFAEPARRDSRPGIIDFEVTDDSSQRLEMEKRRHFVRTLSEDDPEPAPPSRGRGTLARIPIRRMAPVREDAGEPTTLEEAERAVRRAASRDRVGDLVAFALARFSGADVGAVFTIREPVAIGWKGVVRGGLIALDSLAVALDEPGALLATAHDRDGVAVVDARSASPVDRRLWRALGCGEPPCAIATRVAIAGQPVCLLYVQGERADGAHDVVTRLADATRAAISRLLRAAQR
jgi:hypothetical protein